MVRLTRNTASPFGYNNKKPGKGGDGPKKNKRRRKLQENRQYRWGKMRRDPRKGLCGKGNKGTLVGKRK